MAKLINFWRDGIPVESGAPQEDVLVLRAIEPSECEGTVILQANEEAHALYEVVSVGPKVTGFAPGDIVLPVFEALRSTGKHLACRQDEITIRWERSQLEVADAAA